MAGYSVTYTVVDQATAQINAINKRIQQLRAPLEKQAQAMSKFIDVSGLRAVENGFKRIAGAALSTASAMSKIVPAMGALTGAATIAGIGKLVTDFSNLASELTKTGALLDETPERLSGVAQAMRSIGGNAQTAIDALVELKNTTYDAALGMNSVAAAAFARLGVAIVDTGNNFRDVIDVEGDLFKALDKMPNAMDRQREALRVGGQALADTYQQYKLAGITEEEWIRRQKEMETLNKDRTRTFLQFQTSLAKVNTAFYDLGIKVSGAVAPVLTDLFTRLSTWVDNNAPEITATVERVATAFENWAKNGGFNEIAKGLGAIGDALSKIFKVMEWMEAHPTITGAVLGGLVGARFGGLPGAIAGAGAGGLAGTRLEDNSWQENYNAAKTKYYADKNSGVDKRSFSEFDRDYRAANPPGVAAPAPAATPTPAAPGPQGAATPGAPSPADPRGMIPVIRAAAIANGVDPDVAVRVAQSEGLGTFGGDIKDGKARSGGAFQLFTGGGLGNQFQKETGLDPLDPANEQQTIAWAMKNVAKTGWGPYHGAAGAGISDRQGLPGAPVAAAAPGGVPKGVNPELHQAMAGAFASVLPPGYTAKMTSGVRGGNPNSQHYTGSAEDWQIYDSKGQSVPNSGADRSGLYHAAAVAGLASLMQTNPALAKRFAWGGHFETSAGSGTPDLMHYDIGGPRGRFGDPMAERAEAALLAARGPNAQLAGGGAMPNGSVNIDINHKNAPAGVSVAANLVAGGGINVNPPRVEHQSFGVDMSAAPPLNPIGTTSPGNAVAQTGTSWLGGTWWQQLQPGSWRGVGFILDTAPTKAGRRVAVHEYPYRDTVWPEDLGKLPRRFQVTGFLVGDNCYQQKRSMIAACEQAGAGTLVHPILGAMQCVLVDFTTTDRRDRGRYVEVGFEFIDAGATGLSPAGALATGNVVQSMATALNSASSAALSLNLAGLPLSNALAPIQAVTSWANLAVTAVNDPARALSAVAGLPGLFGRYANGALSVLQPATATVSSLLSAAVNTRQAVINTANALTGAVRSL